MIGVLCIFIILIVTSLTIRWGVFVDPVEVTFLALPLDDGVTSGQGIELVMDREGGGAPTSDGCMASGTIHWDVQSDMIGIFCIVVIVEMASLTIFRDITVI